jgi:hypothetical protein
MQIPSLSMRTRNPCQESLQRGEKLIYKKSKQRAKDAYLNLIGNHSWKE